MRFFDRLFGREEKQQGLYERWLQLLEVGAATKSGQNVTLQKAFRVSAFLACLRAIGQGCAQVPLKLFQDYEKDGLERKRVARDHDLYDLIAAKPNGWQTSFEFRETMAMHAAMGNAYAYKGMYRGRPAELILLDPSLVQPKQNSDWTIKYQVSGRDGGRQELDASQIWHIRGPSWDGFLGMDVLAAAREALGLSMAMETSQAALHANGVRPSGIYSVEGTLESTQKTKLTSWLKTHASAGLGTPLVLDRNAKWLQQTMSGVDAQVKEIRDQQIEEVCRFMGVLPIVIGHTGDKANTYASAETMFAAHRVQCLAPWWTRIQSSADVNLLTDEERKQGYYFKHVANALLLASAKDQADYFSKALGSGGSPAWHTQDEVRALLEYDPMGGAAASLPVATNVPAAPVN